jgi:hypothetical protein
MSIRNLERRLDDVEATLAARPVVFVVSCKPLDDDVLVGAFAEARRKAGVAPGAPAQCFNVATGVAR